MLDLSRFAYKKKQKSTGSEKPSNEVVTPNNAHTTDAVVTVVPETPLSVIRKAPNTLNNGKKKGKRVLHSSSFSEDSDQRDSEGNEDSRTRTLTGPVAAPRSIFEGFKTCKRQKRSVGSSQNAADENLQEAVVAMSCTHSLTERSHDNAAITSSDSTTTPGKSSQTPSVKHIYFVLLSIREHIHLNSQSLECIYLRASVSY